MDVRIHSETIGHGSMPYISIRSLICSWYPFIIYIWFGRMAMYSRLRPTFRQIYEIAMELCYKSVRIITPRWILGRALDSISHCVANKFINVYPHSSVVADSFKSFENIYYSCPFHPPDRAVQRGSTCTTTGCTALTPWRFYKCFWWPAFFHLMAYGMLFCEMWTWRKSNQR